MARTDLESLVVQLSADFKSFEKSLARANDVSNRQFNAIERRARQMNKNLDGIFTRSFSGLTAPLAGIGAALGVDQLRQMTDTWTDMTSRVNLAAGSIDKGTEVMGRLGEMARRTYSDLTQTAESYLSNATALKELGYNTDESLNYTEALNNALVVSGAKGDRAARVIDALAKAMALGKLQGDNLNTVIDSGGRAAEALAAGLGTTVGGLRKLGAEGKITGQDIVRGLSSQMEKLRQEAADMPATIGDGFTLLNNALLQYVGNADSAAGVSAKISEALVMIADNFDKVADNGLRLAGVIAGALVGRSLAGMIRTLGLAGTALASFTQALAAARTMGGLATAFGGLGAAAGPVGMIIGGAVVSSMILYNNTAGASSEAALRFAERLKKVEEAAKSSGDAVEEAGQKNKNYNLNTMKEDVKEASDQFLAAREQVVAYFDEVLAGIPAFKLVRDEAGNLSRQEVASPEQIRQLQSLRDELAKNANKAGDVQNSLQALANLNPNFQELANRLNPLLEKLINISTAARQTMAAVADANASRGRSAKDDVQPVDLNQLAADAYEKEALRKASLNKKEHALEMERIRVRNDAIKDGTKLTEEAIDRIAKANLAAQESRTAEGKKPKKEKKEKETPEEKFSKGDLQSISDRTSALVSETEALRQLNPLIDDYGFAAEMARTEQELLNAAQKAGIELTPALKEEIRQTAEQWALATAEANKLAEAQGELRQKAEEWRDAEKDALGGLVSDLAAGKNMADALADALQKVLDKLLSFAFDGLFDGIFGKTGSIFGGLFRKDGGPVKAATGGLIRGPGGPRTDSIPAMLSDGEYVINAKATKQNRALLEAINSGRSLALAGGGRASLKAPTMPVLQAPSQARSAQSAPQININIASASGDDYIRAVVSDGVNQGLRQYDKSGPMRFARDSKQANRRGLVR